MIRFTFLRKPYMSLSYAWWKKYVFDNFRVFFYHFRPCKCIGKHAFAGQNTQHVQFSNGAFRFAVFCHFLNPKSGLAILILEVHFKAKNCNFWRDYHPKLKQNIEIFDTIWNPKHWTIIQLLTIWKPDMFGIWIPPYLKLKKNQLLL